VDFLPNFARQLAPTKDQIHYIWALHLIQINPHICRMYFPDPDLNSGKLLFGLQIRSLCSPLGHCEIILLSTYYFISTYYNIFLLLVCPTSGFYSNFHVSYWSLSAAATDYSLFFGGGVWGEAA